MLSYRVFVKILQIIFISTYSFAVAFIMKEDFDSLKSLVIGFFPIMMTLVEVFRGDED